jgi:hypothetical protein
VTRFKWYKVRVAGSTSAFLRRIKEGEFSATDESGFLHVGDEGKSANFRFVWRSSVVAVTLDDHGAPVRHVVNSLDQVLCTFHVGDLNLIWMRVTDPPRVLRELLNALERIAGLGFSVEQQTFSHKKQLQLLKRCGEYRLIGLRGVGSSAEHRQDGIYPERLEFLAQLHFSPDHASYEILEQGLKGQVTFTATGLVRVSGALLPLIVNQLERQLGIGMI